LGACALLASTLLTSQASSELATLGRGSLGWSESGLGAIRGITIGPIESALHPNRGYGTEAYVRSLREARRLGATWVSLTPFSRVWNLAPTGISLTFEEPFAQNRKAVARAIEQAHREGLRVLLVPHIWVETGGWRGELDPGDALAWQRFAEAYTVFIEAWAKIARDSRADMFSVGVELRSWVTTPHAPSFDAVIDRVRSVYPGLLTYAGNWDDIEQTVILGRIDVIGINAFYPLADENGADLATLLEGGRRVAERVRALAELWDKPVMFNEFGYTTRKDPAVRPWEWPEHLSGVVVDEQAQADAYRALLAPVMDAPHMIGAFVWRSFADPDDTSQEPLWGFSPRGKLAEAVLRQAFAAPWAADGRRRVGAGLIGRDYPVGVY
jgi:hypothetical protein